MGSGRILERKKKKQALGTGMAFNLAKMNLVFWHRKITRKARLDSRLSFQVNVIPWKITQKPKYCHWEISLPLPRKYSSGTFYLT